jgi:hypothetical protein
LEKASDAAEVVDGAFFSLAKHDFGLCEDLLDRIEVGVIGRQEDEPGAGGADGTSDGAALVGPKLSMTTMSPGWSVGTSNCST